MRHHIFLFCSVSHRQAAEGNPADQQSSIMSAELDLSPPDVPEPTFLESVLRYGLFLGAIFQLICILAIIIPTSKGHEQVDSQSGKGRSRQ